MYQKVFHIKGQTICGAMVLLDQTLFSTLGLNVQFLNRIKSKTIFSAIQQTTIY